MSWGRRGRVSKKNHFYFCPVIMLSQLLCQHYSLPPERLNSFNRFLSLRSHSLYGILFSEGGFYCYRKALDTGHIGPENFLGWRNNLSAGERCHATWTGCWLKMCYSALVDERNKSWPVISLQQWQAGKRKCYCRAFNWRQLWISVGIWLSYLWICFDIEMNHPVNTIN